MYIKYSPYESSNLTLKSRENEIEHAVEQITKKSCKNARSGKRSAAIKKGVKADEQGDRETLKKCFKSFV